MNKRIRHLSAATYMKGNEMSSCGQCEYYMNRQDKCPNPEARALDMACDKFNYTNPEQRIDYLQTENKRLEKRLKKSTCPHCGWGYNALKEK